MEAKLKEAVERIVRPIPAEESLKDRLREELWGHLETLYSEELGRCGNHYEAQAVAIERLGDAKDIRRNYVTSLSIPNRIMGWIDYAVELRPGASPWRKAWQGCKAGFLSGIAAAIALWSLVYIPTPNDLEGANTVALLGLSLAFFQPLIFAACYPVLAWLRSRFNREPRLFQRLGYTAAGQLALGTATALAAMLAYTLTEMLAQYLLGPEAQGTFVIQHIAPVLFAEYGGLLALLIPAACLIDQYHRRRLPDWPYAIQE